MTSPSSPSAGDSAAVARPREAPTAAALSPTLDVMREGVIAFDVSGRIAFANRAADAMYASVPGGLVGRSIAELSARPAWEAAHVAEAIETELRAGNAWSGDRHNRRLDGQEFVSAATITRLLIDGVEHRLCVEEDVTGQRRSEARAAFLSNATSILGQSLDYRESLGALARLCIPELADFAVIDVLSERGAVERVGCSHRAPQRELELCQAPARSETVTRTPLFVRDVGADALTALAEDPRDVERWRALSPRSWISIPIMLQEEALGALILGMSESGRRFDEGDLEVVIALAGRAASAIDNARLHAAATAARDEAERANRAKSELLAHASHDLRTPLNAIGGYAELLEMEILGPVSDAQRDALARIQRSQRHLLALINDLLNFTKLEAGNVEFDLMEIDVAHVAREAASLLEEQAASKGIVVRIDREARPRAWADGEKVFQIVHNLVRNAVKFTPSGGTVTITAAERGEHTEVVVRDTGIGIPDDKREAIFEPFTQLGRSINRPQEGSGLGLAISRELTRAMRGELRVTSTVGEGTAFTLVLPRTSRSPRSAT